MSEAQPRDTPPPSTIAPNPDYVSRYIERPATWNYDIDQANGSSRAVYTGEVWGGNPPVPLTVPGGGPFLPLAGGSMQGPLRVDPAGATTPPFTIRAVNDAATMPYVAGMMLALAADTGQTRIDMTGAGGNIILGRTSGGTLGAPTATPTGILLNLSGGGHDGTQWVGGKCVITLGSEDSQIWTPASTPTKIQFAVAPIGSTVSAERMRLTSGGALLVGLTATANTERFHVAGAGILDTAFAVAHAGGYDVVTNQAGIGFGLTGGMVVEMGAVAALTLNRYTNDGAVAQFDRNAVGVGTISVTATATAYNTSSDERLKDDFRPIAEAGAIIDALSVHDFRWKGSRERAHGVTAQACHHVYPRAVHHDEASDWWGVDYSKFVPLLLAECQALRKRVAELERGQPKAPGRRS